MKILSETPSFVAFDDEKQGLLFDETTHEKFPLNYVLLRDTRLTMDKPYFGFVQSGWVKVNDNIMLTDGMYISSNREDEIEVCGKFIVINIFWEHEPMFHVGGPIEAEGRLNYIDGCTDSLLISPVKKGDPCLNHLHFPSGIDQTQHTHPSHRIGIVARGRGECITPFGNLPLEEGMIFVIKEWDGKSYAEGISGEDFPLGQHSFKTFDEGMDVIAFHPDSDFGPEDEFHPMINRTIVDGKPAPEHPEFGTFKTTK